MANDDQKVLIGLLRERADKLEATLRYYDTVLNTPRADALRKRNAELESALWRVVDKGELGAADLAELKVMLGNKSTPIY